MNENRTETERKKRMKALYMAVTNDKHELPVAVRDNAKELADMYGMRRDNLYAYISHGNVRKKDNVKFVRVET